MPADSPQKSKSSEGMGDVPYRVPMSRDLEGSVYSDPPVIWTRIMPIKDDTFTWEQIYKGEASPPVSEQLPQDLDGHPFQGSTYIPLEPGCMVYLHPRGDRGLRFGGRYRPWALMVKPKCLEKQLFLVVFEMLFNKAMGLIAAAATVASFAYWFNFLLNDPFHLGWKTMDSRHVTFGHCQQFGLSVALSDVLALLPFFASHSLLARRSVKKAIGVFDEPYEQSVYFGVSSLTLAMSVYLWCPVSDCSSFNMTDVSLLKGVLWFGLSIIGMVLTTASSATVISLLGKKRQKKLVKTFPYSIHTLRTTCSWGCYELYSLSAVVLLEEADLRDPIVGFGKEYDKYAEEVNAFIPSRRALGCVFCR
ncbi:hypothetical protein FOL47_006029 [Perkinsus chesapeaki]|uniref:Uncharacterized protein n=1 Tax=Perkinsus chesapeaki TaxID=330153 RepID=A0A7J6LUA5_PERCH|nr:hypothetical protein FOL47_006029 [Perkinsus chesapeaki]